MEQGQREHHPQVLLLGNGINLAFGGRSWSGLMKSLSTRTDLPEELSCPMPMQAIIYTENKLKDAMKGKRNELFGSVETPEQMAFLQQLLGLPADEIITTNYSYELEAAALDRFRIGEAQLKTLLRHSPKLNRAEPKYLIQTYNQVGTDHRVARIWHAHGEARKPDSMIIGHYYYAKLLGRMIQYIDSRSQEHQRRARSGLAQEIGSWTEAFLFGDVYILGFGFDISEFDLWWLLNRKKREIAPHGKTYLFEMRDRGFSERKDLLRLLDVELVDFGMEKPSANDLDCCARYEAFYKRAVAEMKRMIENHTEERAYV